ncbi:hypothetical protein FB451DRAFT_1395697 [Mycena latifolia]|nr:hypothetical protein FB451DRAFT_1395697 [Mycena latifolia]
MSRSYQIISSMTRTVGFQCGEDATLNGQCNGVVTQTCAPSPASRSSPLDSELACLSVTRLALAPPADVRAWLYLPPLYPCTSRGLRAGASRGLRVAHLKHNQRGRIRAYPWRACASRTYTGGVASGGQWSHGSGMAKAKQGVCVAADGTNNAYRLDGEVQDALPQYSRGIHVSLHIMRLHLSLRRHLAQLYGCTARGLVIAHLYLAHHTLCFGRACAASCCTEILIYAWRLTRFYAAYGRLPIRLARLLFAAAPPAPLYSRVPLARDLSKSAHRVATRPAAPALPAAVRLNLARPLLFSPLAPVPRALRLGLPNAPLPRRLLYGRLSSVLRAFASRLHLPLLCTRLYLAPHLSRLPAHRTPLYEAPRRGACTARASTQTRGDPHPWAFISRFPPCACRSAPSPGRSVPTQVLQVHKPRQLIPLAIAFISTVAFGAGKGTQRHLLLDVHTLSDRPPPVQPQFVLTSIAFVFHPDSRSGLRQAP